MKEMKKGISKILESAMAQAVFNTAQIGTNCSLKDCLMFQILTAEGSMAYRTLGSILEDWQLFQLKLRLERVAYRMGRDITPPDEFFKAYAEELAERTSDKERVSTIDAVIDIWRIKPPSRRVYLRSTISQPRYLQSRRQTARTRRTTPI